MHKCASNLACPKVNSLPPPRKWNPPAPMFPLSANGTLIGRLLDLPTPENHPCIPLLPFCLTSAYSISLCICQLSFQCISGNRHLFSPFGSLSLSLSFLIKVYSFLFIFLTTLCSVWNFPGQGLSLNSLQWKCGVLTTGLPGMSSPWPFSS